MGNFVIGKVHIRDAINIIFYDERLNVVEMKIFQSWGLCRIVPGTKFEI